MVRLPVTIVNAAATLRKRRRTPRRQVDKHAVKSFALIDLRLCARDHPAFQ